MQMEFPGCAASSSATSYASQMNRLLISAEEGWFELRPAFSYGGLEGRTHEGELDIRPVNQQAQQMDDFSKCIMEEEESTAGGEEGLRDLKVIEAIYRSVKSGNKEKV